MSTCIRYRCFTTLCTLLFVVLAFPTARGGDASPGEPHHPLISGKGRADEALLKEFSDAQWLALVPAQSPRKAAGFAKLGEKNVPLSDWTWDANTPNRLTCKATGEVYPSAAFPMKSIKTEVLSGKNIEIPCVDGGKKNEKVFPQAYIDYQKYLFIERQLSRLGAAYAGTGDERYARIAALILDEWANRIPDYFIGQGNPGLPPISPTEAENEKWFCCRASIYNAMAHEWPHNALSAFDCIYDSKALDDLSALRKYNVRDHIKKDLFENIGDVFAKRIKPEWAIRTNLSLPYMVLADAATILNRPDYIEYLNGYLKESITENFKRDGMFPESFSYHRGYADVNEAVVKNVARYFELRPANTDALRAIKAACDERAAFMHRAATAHFPVCYPNGLIPPFGDSAAANDAPRKETYSALLPAYGHAALGRGSEDQETQLNMGWGDFNNHCQDDVLGFTLFAFGAELIGNNRYDRGPSRPFNNHTLGHNTVVIDRQTQPRRKAEGSYTSGNLTLYEAGDDGIAVAEVDGSRAYADMASRYQRLLILNTVDPAHPYALDFFAVAGGTTHDYVLHGSSTFAEKAHASFAVKALADPHPLLAAGEKWQDPATGNFPVYGMILNASEGRSPGAWSVDFLGEKGGSPTGTRLHMLDDATNHVFVGESPVLGSGQNDIEKSAETETEREKGKHPAEKARPDVSGTYSRTLRPSVLVRREGTAGSLKSVFVALIEPIKGKSAIAGFETLPLKADDPENVAVRIRFVDGRVDTVLVNLDNPNVAGCPVSPHGFETRDGGAQLDGRIGFHIRSAAGTEQIKTIGATRFRCGTQTAVPSPGQVSGFILGAERRADGAKADVLITDAELPEGKALVNTWMSVSFGTYKTPGGKEQKNISEQFQIEHIERLNGKTLIYTKGDHALSVSTSGVTEIMRPHRAFNGACRFTVYFSQSLQTFPH